MDKDSKVCQGLCQRFAWDTSGVSRRLTKHVKHYFTFKGGLGSKEKVWEPMIRELQAEELERHIVSIPFSFKYVVEEWSFHVNTSISIA